MTLCILIAKFKFHQYERRAVSPNLMLAKITRYTVLYVHAEVREPGDKISMPTWMPEQ